MTPIRSSQLLVGASVVAGVAVAVAVGVVIGVELGGGGRSSDTVPAAGTRAGTKTQTGTTIVRVDSTWTCRRAVDLHLVRVTMTPAAGAIRRHADAIHLRPGCTGRIGRVEVTQSAGDGIKVAEGVHDLEIDGGFVHCPAKAPGLHQDGIQVLGGDRITFRHLDVDCGRAGERLINSNLFIREAGRSTHPPTDVVCDECTFGGNAAHTVSIQKSVRSGVTGSTLCPAKYPRQMLAVGPQAVDPVTGGNTIGACGGAQAGRKVIVLTRAHRRRP